jgi:hypothetical protein
MPRFFDYAQDDMMAQDGMKKPSTDNMKKPLLNNRLYITLFSESHEVAASQ